MPIKKIDIEKYCNHKFIYEKKPDKREKFGVDDICMIKDIFLSTQKLNINEEEAFFYYILKANGMDNILCEGQTIKLNLPAKRIHLAGFVNWGDINENIKIVFSDDSHQIKKVAFIDWSHPFEKYYFWQYPDLDKADVKDLFSTVAYGDFCGAMYFHDSICKLDTDKTIKEIILPNNMFIHIFAITLEF